MIFSKISRNSSIDPECDGCDMMEEEINITNPSHYSPTLIIKCKSSTYDGQFRSHCWWFKIFFQSKIISPDPEIISAPAWMKINQIKTNCIEEGVPRNWSDEFNLNIWIYSKIFQTFAFNFLFLVQLQSVHDVKVFSGHLWLRLWSEQSAICVLWFHCLFLQWLDNHIWSTDHHS